MCGGVRFLHSQPYRGDDELQDGLGRAWGRRNRPQPYGKPSAPTSAFALRYHSTSRAFPTIPYMFPCAHSTTASVPKYMHMSTLPLRQYASQPGGVLGINEFLTHFEMAKSLPSLLHASWLYLIEYVPVISHPLSQVLHLLPLSLCIAR